MMHTIGKKGFPMINKRFDKYHLILASQSPRRQYLLKELGLNFEICTTHVKEVYPDHLNPEQIAIHLAELKADSFDTARLEPKSLVIAADTIVWLDGEVLGKPGNYTDAVKMLLKLSGKKHDVITAVCLKSRNRKKNLFRLSLQFILKSSAWRRLSIILIISSPLTKQEGTAYRNGSGTLASAGSKVRSLTLWDCRLKSFMRSY